MNATTQSNRTHVVVLAGVAALYVAGLSQSPVYLLNDEVFNALHAMMFAKSGRSFAGDALPVYFRGLEFAPGRDPLCVYATAAALKLLPITEATLRLPTALVGIANVVLTYLIGRRLWGDARWALVTALVVALSPGHFINSRIAIPTLWSTPWLLGWCLGMIIHHQTRRLTSLFLAGLCLGIAVYGYLGTALLVPLYGLLSVAFLFFTVGHRSLRPYAVLFAGAMLPMCLIVYWHVLHPERWRELADYYTTNSAAMRRGAPLFGADGVPSFAGLQDRVSAYWNYFNPTLFFLSGDASLRYSTGRSGVFLIPAVLLMPIGLYHAAHDRGVGRLLVWCFLTAPVTAALTGDVQVQRAMPLVIFGALLCAWGAVWMVSHDSRRVRQAAFALGLVAAIQFGAFLYDYYGHYRLRSGAWRGGNLRGAFARVIEASHERDRAVIYLDENIENVGVYWQFYAVAYDAGALTDRALVTAPSQVTNAPIGSLFITGTQQGFTVTPAEAETWQLRERIYELDGPTFFSIFEKVR